jgi:hypothetical protein
MQYADQSDHATALEEAERNYMESAVRKAANSKNRDLVPVGTCYYCTEDVGEGKIFCNSDCGAGYDQEQAARKRNGK